MKCIKVLFMHIHNKNLGEYEGSIERDKKIKITLSLQSKTKITIFWYQFWQPTLVFLPGESHGL